MSVETKKGKPLVSSYTPLDPPPKEPSEEERKSKEQVSGIGGPPQEPMMTAAQYQNLARFYAEQAESFKKLFEDSTLAKWIKLAGIGGAAGVVLVIIEIIRALAWLIGHFK